VNRYNIEKYKASESVKLYTVRFIDADLSETDHFITRFMADKKHKKDLDIIIYWVQKITENGALERYFRPEKRAVAIPLSSGNSLRLYCYRINDETIILGNGGIKTSKKVQDSPDCFPHFELMNHVAKKVYWGLKDNEITVSKGELEGKLTFNY
jgi:hypothetical protein